MPTNPFASDFFDNVLGTASSGLQSWIQALPNFPDLSTPPPTFAPEQNTLYTGGGFGGGDQPSAIFGGGFGADSPFLAQAQSAINNARSGGMQATPAYLRSQGDPTVTPQGTPAAPAYAPGQKATPAIAPQGELVDYAKQVAAHYGINPDIFVRQIQQESGFNPKARSKAGAMGIGQFIAATAAAYGVDVNDPYSSLDGAARYMRDNLAHNGGDYAKALAAYNAGQGAVDKYGGVPPFQETQNYVRTILGK